MNNHHNDDPGECLPMIADHSIAELLTRLRDKIGLKELAEIIGCDHRVVTGYIRKGMEPGWQRGKLIYNLAARELGPL